MPLKVIPFGPLYTADIRLRLGKDALWGRENAEAKTREVNARSPDGLWQNAILALTEMVGLGESKFVYGLLLNLINNMPAETRSELLMGIVTGTGMTIDRKNNELVVSVLANTFPPISVNQPAEPQLGSGLVVAGGGLIVPRGSI